MRKGLILLFFSSFFMAAQNYNPKIELEGHLGFYKTTVGTADNYHNYVGTPFSFDIGLTKYITPSFGFKLSTAYFNLKANRYNNSFNTDYFRGSLLGSIDFRNALQLNSWYGLNLDLGFGYTEFYPKIDSRLTNREKAGHIIGTLTNKFYLSGRLRLNLSVELIGHYNMDYTFDGTRSTGDPLDAEIGRNTGISDGTIYNFKVGLSYVIKRKEEEKQKIEDTVINNYYQIQKDTIINNFYVNIETDPYDSEIFFTFDSYSIDFDDSKVDNHQVNILRKIAEKLKNNPQHKLQVIGFTDYRGSVGYNEILAYRRVETVVDILSKLGVSRIQLKPLVKGKQKVTDKDITQFDRVVKFKLM